MSSLRIWEGVSRFCTLPPPPPLCRFLFSIVSPYFYLTAVMAWPSHLISRYLLKMIVNDGLGNNPKQWSMLIKDKQRLFNNINIYIVINRLKWWKYVANLEFTKSPPWEEWSPATWHVCFKFSVMKVRRTIVIAPALLLSLLLSPSLLLLLSMDKNFNLGHNYEPHQIGLSYFTCVFLVTRPFTSYHNFWPSDLDLEVWPTFQKL